MFMSTIRNTSGELSFCQEKVSYTPTENSLDFTRIPDKESMSVINVA